MILANAVLIRLDVKADLMLTTRNVLRVTVHKFKIAASKCYCSRIMTRSRLKTSCFNQMSLFIRYDIHKRDHHFILNVVYREQKISNLKLYVFYYYSIVLVQI